MFHEMFWEGKCMHMVPDCANTNMTYSPVATHQYNTTYCVEACDTTLDDQVNALVPAPASYKE
jgi:hypothetical protein